MKYSDITIDIRTEFLCEYENIYVFAIWMDNKFSSILSVDGDTIKD
jgi:hypothetical protein